MTTNYHTVLGTRIQGIAGKRFGSWTVLRYGHQPDKPYHLLCRCDCGTEKFVLWYNLRDGRSKRCAKCASGDGPLTPERIAHRDMHCRCYRSKHPEYPNYGARGITVCKQWRNNFPMFIADMGPRPSAKHSLDRIDNNGNYEPGNCRWATLTEQNRNQRSNHILTFRGRTLCIAEWAEVTGICDGTLYSRITKQGWTTERALTTPVKQKQNS